MTDNLTGQTLQERYRFDAVIGEGTFARVYRVFDMRRGANLAAKVLRTDIAHEASFLERFRREADVLARLQHPHIVRYYETVEAENLVFILMDYIDGKTLQTHLYETRAPMPLSEALPYIRQMISALAYAHGENIIHRDVKPANILMAEKIYLTDFGIARLLDEASTLTQGAMVGTPLYMSPEQINSQPVTVATDIYSMGVVIFQMLTGEVPFNGKSDGAKGSTVSERVAYEHVNTPPPPARQFNPDLPLPAELALQRCLQKEPAARFPSITAVYDALAEVIGATPASFEPIVAAKPQPPDVTLPEWSQVVPTVTAPETQPHMEAVEPRTQPTQPLTQTHMERVESTVRYTPAVAQPEPAPRRNVWMIGVLALGAFGLVVALCAALVLLSFDLLSDDNSSNPTRRPTQSETTVADVVPDTTLVPTPTQLPVIGDPVDNEIAISTDDSDVDGGATVSTEFSYAAENDGNLDIYVRNDGVTVRLTSSSLNETGPAYSPDGSQIAYYAYPDGGNADIWLMNADGTNQRSITSSPNADERVVVWSPDSTRLAYHSDADGDFDIYVYDVASGQTTNLTNSNFDDVAPSWSPDGQRIAFHSDEDAGFNEIFVIGADGSGRDQITNGNWRAAFPAWSPNGQQIAFHSIIGSTYELHIIQPDGTGYRRLEGVTANGRNPAWSSDGAQLVYMAGGNAPSIYSYNLVTGENTLLASNGFFPDWRPGE